MCSNTLKYITIANDFIQRSVTRLPNRLRLKWSLSKVSDFSGQDQLQKILFTRSSKMYKKTLVAVFISSSILVNPLFASNIFQKFMSPHPIKKTSEALKSNSGLKTKRTSENFVDFSGTWVGTCTGSGEGETVTTTIENSDSDITMNDQNYSIGALQTLSDSDEDGTSFFHIFWEWSADRSSLLINSSFIVYNRGPEKRESIFSNANGTMSLKNDQLILELNGYSSGYDNAATMTCTYKKQ